MTVEDAADGLRLDQYLSDRFPSRSRTYLQGLVSGGQIRLNDAAARPRTKVRRGDQITVSWPTETPFELQPETMDFDVLYEDDDMFVINKPPDLVVHPGAGTHSGTLVNALLGLDYERYAEMLDNDPRPGIVHRLDKDTSGVLVIARHAAAGQQLSSAFAERLVSKSYLAVVAPAPARDSGSIENLIGRHPRQRQRMAVVQRNGKVAHTEWRLLSQTDAAALLEVQLHTGRTHQIRVHLAWQGTPIVGDAVYGRPDRDPLPAPRQLLHAWRVTVPQPSSGERLTITAPLPDDLQRCLDALGLTLTVS